MLGYAVMFFLIALVAAWLGFGVVSGMAAMAAKVLFIVFVVLFVLSLLRGRSSGWRRGLDSGL